MKTQTRDRVEVFAKHMSNEDWYPNTEILKTQQLKKKKMNNPIQNWARNLNRHLTRKDTQLTNKHMKRYSILYIIRELQIKTIIMYHYTYIRMAKIQTTDNTKCWQGWGTTGTLIHWWWEWKMVQPLWKTVGSFLQH